MADFILPPPVLLAEQIIHEEVIFFRGEIGLHLSQYMLKKIFFKMLLADNLLGLEASNRFESSHGVEHACVIRLSNSSICYNSSKLNILQSLRAVHYIGCFRGGGRNH